MHNPSRFDIASLMMQCLAVVLFFLVVILLAIHLAVSAFAHEGENREAAWFRSLYDSRGQSCCSSIDCKALDADDARIQGDHWQVKLGGEWRDVPSDKVLRVANEIGKPTVCASQWQLQGVVQWHIRCFVPGTLT